MNDSRHAEDQDDMNQIIPIRRRTEDAKVENGAGEIGVPILVPIFIMPMTQLQIVRLKCVVKSANIEKEVKF